MCLKSRKNVNSGIGEWLSGYQQCGSFKVRSSALTFSGSQLPVITAPGNLMPFSGFYGHLHTHGTQKLIQEYMHMHNFTNLN